MRFAGLKKKKNRLQLQLEASEKYYLLSWKLEVKMKANNIFQTRK
jgi:hypothetical protein